MKRHFDLRKKAMNRLFHLRTKTTWTCQDCNTVHVGRDKDIGLNLAMPDIEGKSRDLNWYLWEHFADQTRSGLECHSAACTIQPGVYMRRDREQSRLIVGGPEILVIQLKRMRFIQGKKSWRTEKVEDHVKYSDRLDLSEYSDGHLSYQLNGIVAHSGETLTDREWCCPLRRQNDR
jgi:hypothetical protein